MYFLEHGVVLRYSFTLGVVGVVGGRNAECEGVSNTTPCCKMYTGLYSGYLPPYIFENFSSYKIPIFVKFCVPIGNGIVTNEGVSITTPCCRMYTGLYSGYLPPYIFENFSSYKTSIFVKFCVRIGNGIVTNVCRNCVFLTLRF